MGDVIQGGTGGVAQEPWSYLNNSDQLSIDMKFNHGHVVSITVYSVLMVISAVGNLTVLTLLIKRRRASRASKLDMFLMHLAIADLLVTFVMMPLEIAWAATVSWRAGAAMCRFMMFGRTFGLYLSSFVLVCISIDRYYAVLKPLCVTGERRARLSLLIAWIGATVASLPQSYIFHLDRHPQVPDYQQCVTYGSLPTKTHEFVYFSVNMFLMYLLPLFSTLYCYSAVLVEIIKKVNLPHEKVRRSGVGLLGKARARTLKMTITILLVFFACWTPYYILGIWHWADPESANQLDPAVRKGLWLFSCTNSCTNPIVYGLFNVRSDKRANGRRGSSTFNRHGSKLPYSSNTLEHTAVTMANDKAALNKHEMSQINSTSYA